MSNEKIRKGFEAAMPIPEGIYWSESHKNYMTSTHHVPCVQYRGSWMGWQAAMRQKESLRKASKSFYESHHDELRFGVKP